MSAISVSHAVNRNVPPDPFAPVPTTTEVRLAFINTHPIQYFAPLYAELNRTAGISVTALYLSDYSVRGATDSGFAREVKWDLDLLAGYDSRFVSGAGRRDEMTGFFSVIEPRLWHDVRSGGFDALVVHGHTPAAVLIAAAAAKASGIPIFMRCETHLGLARSGMKRLLRRPLLGACCRCFDGVLAIGTANHDFYRSIGVPESRIFSVPYTVDNRRFIAGSRMSDADRRELRVGLGVNDDRPIVLFAAKFQCRKRPHDLLRAAAGLAADGLQFHVVMVGSGEMAEELRCLTQELDLDNVTFAGFINQTSLPRVYAACDMFVLPSQDEPWGLAVNEAMCAGLPIIASREIGCVPDLVQDGKNGRTFPAGDVTALADALRPLVSDPALRRRMGAASRKIIAGWSYAECATGLRQALLSVGIVLPDSTQAPVAAVS